MKHRGKEDLKNVTNSTGKIRSSRRMPTNSIEKKLVICLQAGERIWRKEMRK